MKIGIRHYENASCKIVICTAIPNQLRSKTRELISLDVPENLRCQGMATELLRNVTEEADAHEMTLVIFPKPFGEGPKMDVDTLVAWYQNTFGFMQIQEKPVKMLARMPHSTPGPFKLNFVARVVDGDMK